MKIAIPLDENGMLPIVLENIRLQNCVVTATIFVHSPSRCQMCRRGLGPLLFRSLITIPFPYAALLGFIGPLAG